MPWLQLIRWKNLAIILLTQLLVWWCVILPECPAVLVPFNFFLLALSTLLIGAAGYIINDYFDIKIDLINRPEKVVLEKTIPRKQAIVAHTALNVAALLLAGYVAVPAHHIEWLLVQAGCTLLLWFYSTDLKRQYMSGNIAVSLLTAFTIAVLFVFEPTMKQAANMPLIPNRSAPGQSSLPVWVLGIYTYFAFMLTWMREIVKDMEDFIGDEAEGCVTMPIKRGLKYAARFVLALGALVVLPLFAGALVLFKGDFRVLSCYVAGLLVVPLAMWCVFLQRDFTAQHYNKASSGLKIIMILGVFSLLIYHFQINAHSA